MKTILLIMMLIMLMSLPAGGNDFIYQGSFLWNDVRAIVQNGDYLLCAFHDGIGAIDLTQDFNKKKLSSTLELHDLPIRLHLFENILVAESEYGPVSIIDVTDPTDMRYLGSFTPEWEIFDLEMIDHFLYAAVEYDGIARYDLSDPGNIIFKDSSMFGIRIIALDVADGRLFALDDYNGILIYEPDSTAFDAPVSELLLPQAGLSLTVNNDTVYCGLNPTGYMLGYVADLDHPVYLGQQSSFIRADRIDVTTDGIVISNSYNGFELQYNQGDTLIDQLFPLGNIRGFSSVYQFDNQWYISFPHEELGFVAYDIGDPERIALDFPDVIYAYPGPITQVQFFKSRLHTIGSNNWYEIYDLSEPSRPTRSAKIINPPYKPAGFCYKGDTLFIADIKTKTYFPAIDDGLGDPVLIFPFFSVLDSMTRPSIIPDFFGDLDLLYFHNGWTFNGSARNDTMEQANLIRWHFIYGVTALELKDRILYQGNRKNSLKTYSIDEENLLTLATQRDLPSRVNDILPVDTLLYLGAGNLIIAEITDPLAPNLIYTLYEPRLVFEMHKIGSWLVCAASNGLFIYDISGDLPQLLFSGGDPAFYVTYDNNRLAASDGKSIKIYTLPAVDADDDSPVLPQYLVPRLNGYPNPFNPDIRLVMENFAMPGRVQLVVFDILGRKVRDLTPAMTGLGRLEAQWDGRDDDGRKAASGVYFFKAWTPEEQVVFRAILIK
ncbi:MAG: hypothetical protein GY841_23640 [FCB group bacterium]|nr:hypothetical protein [FCB group bacterium]